MTCAEAENEFLAHERGEQTSGEFETHLERCAECACAFDEFVAAGRLLRELPAVRLERDLAAAVRSARQDRAARWQPRPWFAPGLAAAAVVALVAIGLLRLQPGADTVPEAATAAAPAASDQQVALEPTHDPEVAAPAPGAVQPPALDRRVTHGRPVPESPAAGRGGAQAEGGRRGPIHDYGPSAGAILAEEPAEPAPQVDESAGMESVRLGAGLGGGAAPAEPAEMVARGPGLPRGPSGPPGAATGAMGGAFGSGDTDRATGGGGGLGGAAPPAPAALSDATETAKGRPEAPANGAEARVYDFRFREAPVSEALRTISERTGEQVRPPEGEAGRARVTIQMEGVSAREALNRVCKAAGLRLRLRADGTLSVGPAPDAPAAQASR